jgi:hypothetical protein
MNAFVTVVIIMAVVFGVGVAVGSILVMALPLIMSTWFPRAGRVQPPREDTTDRLDTGPPRAWTRPGDTVLGNTVPGNTEPDDRDDPYWRDGAS